MYNLETTGGLALLSLKLTIDLISTIFSLIATYYFVKADVRGWVYSLIAVSLNAILFFQQGIYAEMTLQGLYIIMSLYGWFIWLFGLEKEKPLTISRINLNQTFILGAVGFISILFCHYYLKEVFHSTVPLLDASSTIISITAEWLLCRKILESWYLWFVADVIYIFLYFTKGLPFHGIMVCIYLIMCINGWWFWTKTYKATQSNIILTPQLENA